MFGPSDGKSNWSSCLVNGSLFDFCLDLLFARGVEDLSWLLVVGVGVVVRFISSSFFEGVDDRLSSGGFHLGLVVLIMFGAFSNFSSSGSFFSRPF